ncbi:MAG: SDR family oxidoreductase [Candidatus Hydrogenedens sp.]|nr:SDR family oxidoreductase [Candidatus Hydrogenedentota bacterium]NLF58129.1 SDR family oxidoreductase [Candidatus Hydrogenedens sp.]
MKILVAGGAGYVGSVLAPLLMERGHEVLVADQCWFGNHLPPSVPLLETDLFAMDDAAMAGFDRVIFLAGLSNDPMAEYDPAMNFVQNGALPAYLAFRAKQAGVRRFVYGSSCSVYGYTLDRLYDEDAPVTCPYPYGISKLQGERGVLQMCDDTFSVVALRQGTVNGHSPRMRFDLIVNTMYKSAVTTGRITVNHPAIWRPLIDVRDTAEAFILAAGADDAVSGVFNVAKDNYTVGEVAGLVRDAVRGLTGGEVEIETHHRQDFRNYKVDCTQARAVLGFNPQYDVPDMVQSLHAHRAEYGDLEEEGYYNIRVFRKRHAGPQ